MTGRPARLVTLLPSTDVELGRWMLRHWKIPYVESPHAPIFHILALKWHGLGKMDFPLLLYQGEKIATVEGLAARFDPLVSEGLRLLPDPTGEPALHDEVWRLQHDIRYGIGEGTVHWAYYHFLQDKRLIWPSLTTRVPWFEAAFLHVGYGLMKRMMVKGLTLGPAGASRALDQVQRGWDLIDARLADGRGFLAGERLTMADLALATSGAPMVLARGYDGHLPDFDRCPPEVQQVVRELRSRPPQQW